MLNQQVLQISGSLGLDTDKIRCLLSILLTFPLSVPLLYFPKSYDPTKSSHIPLIRHLYVLLASFILIFVAFDPDKVNEVFLHLGGITLSVYAVCFIGLRRKWGTAMVKLVWLMVLGHMSYCHLQRQIFDYGSYRIDKTAPLMVLVLKLTAFVWNIHDGSKEESELSSDQKSRMVKGLPSLLEYLSFVLFFGGLTVGPTFEFADYRNFMTGAAFLTKDKKLSIPNTFFASIRCVMTSALFLACVFFFSDKYSMARTAEKMYHPSFRYRFLNLQISGFVARHQYYGIWKMAEAACILSGLGFNGYSSDGKPQFNRVTNVNIMGVDFAQNFRSVIDNWNMGTANWLKHYVYLRLTEKGKKPTFSQVLSTYVVSSLWHGFYPGYYLTFITGAFITEVSKGKLCYFWYRFECIVKHPLV
ncbi:MBOAT, membrane-bound O-acyltransferase family-domain-containing protein [Paraphysoderma sedebokerense]|nr:MBOAT, membrane-bound O-acyltransferase family-domain-containing protein [Paraphysoderma sedebokerense]